jgi:hypothetical protein
VPSDLHILVERYVRMVKKRTYSKPDKLHSAGAETKPRDSGKYHDKSDRISIELETDWLWKEHRTHEGALRRRESCRGFSLPLLDFGYSHGPVRATSPNAGLSKGLSVVPTDLRMRTTFVPA